MKKVKIKIQEGVKAPIKGSKGAACWDIYAKNIEYKGDGQVRVYTGLHIQPPAGSKIVIVPRSSLSESKWMIINTPIQGDEDFTGEYQVRFTAIPTGVKMVSNHIIDETNGVRVEKTVSEMKLTYEDFPFKEGERIAQLFLATVEDFEWVNDEFTETERGVGGFGSTGKN